MRRIIFFLTIFFIHSVLCGQPSREKGLHTINELSAKSIVYFLSHDALQGRQAGSIHATIVAEYLCSRLLELGISPFYTNYHQEFTAYTRFAKRWQTTNKMDTVANYENRLKLKNVLGYIEGENPNEFIVIGAHYDHLGVGIPINNDSIYNGADDNASGVSAVLQIAKAFKVSGVKPKRSVIFAFWDGEEKGALGSSYFVNHFDNFNRIKAYLNFDMIGRNNDETKPQHVVYFYTEAHPEFGENTRKGIELLGIGLEPEYKAWDKPVTGSDQVPFALKNIPVLWYHTDGHPDYHKPSDHYDKLNWQKVVDITKIAFLNAWFLANDF